MAILGFNPSASVVNPDEYKNRFQNPWGVPQALKISPFDKATDPNLGQLSGATALDKLNGILATPMFGGQNFSQEAETNALRPQTTPVLNSTDRFRARQDLRRYPNDPASRLALRIDARAPQSPRDTTSGASDSVRAGFGWGANPQANTADIAKGFSFGNDSTATAGDIRTNDFQFNSGAGTTWEGRQAARKSNEDARWKLRAQQAATKLF